jgi:hypothetical protein
MTDDDVAMHVNATVCRYAHVLTVTDADLLKKNLQMQHDDCVEMTRSLRVYIREVNPTGDLKVTEVETDTQDVAGLATLVRSRRLP